ncbi:hypothetical protein Tco_1496416, partial [Tanacetum coccineum]
IVQIWARSGFNEIEEFFLWMLSKVLGVSLRITSGVREDPNRDGECGFDYLTSGLVSSKADREGCRVSQLDEFLSFYPIPLHYCVILPTSTQTILDAPPGYIGLYTHCFSLANLRLLLNDFFCEVLQYFKVYISRINPFGCSKLMTFIVMCKAYDYEPSVELFRGFFNLCKASSWLTFQKRPEKHISSLLAKVITRIEGWHQRFFFIQDTIVPSKFPQLLLKENMLDDS